MIGLPEFLDRSCWLGRTPIHAPTVVVRTSLQRQIGRYLPELPDTGDTEIWLRMAAHATVCELDWIRRSAACCTPTPPTPMRGCGLEAQKKAFDAHFNAYRRVRPNRLFRTDFEPDHRSGGILEWRRAFDDRGHAPVRCVSRLRVRRLGGSCAGGRFTVPDEAPDRAVRVPMVERVERVAARIGASAAWLGPEPRT